MTDTERKALALVNEVARERGYKYESVFLDRAFAENEALCRAIEQHEAFRQEVSDAVVKATHTMAAGKLVEASGILAALIIAKPDPLVEAFDVVWPGIDKAMVEALRAAIEKRGGKIVWGEG